MSDDAAAAPPRRCRVIADDAADYLPCAIFMMLRAYLIRLRCLRYYAIRYYAISMPRH